MSNQPHDPTGERTVTRQTPAAPKSPARGKAAGSSQQPAAARPAGSQAAGSQATAPRARAPQPAPQSAPPQSAPQQSAPPQAASPQSAPPQAGPPQGFDQPTMSMPAVAAPPQPPVDALGQVAPQAPAVAKPSLKERVAGLLPKPKAAAPAAEGAAAAEPGGEAARPTRNRKPADVHPDRPTRRARLRLTRVDPWSVMKTSFLLSIAFAVVTVVAVLMVWSALNFAGVWDSINSTVRSVLGEDSASGFNVEDYVGTRRVLGFTLVVAVVDVLLLTAIATLAAFLYNLSAALLGGVEVTLAEEGS